MRLLHPAFEVFADYHEFYPVIRPKSLATFA